MLPILLGLLLIVVAGALLWRQRRIRSAWEAVANRYDLERAQSPEHSFPMLTGRIEGFPVEIYDTGHTPSDPTRVVVHLRNSPDVNLVVATRKWIGGEPAPLNHTHVRLGDPELEAVCTVDGNPNHALAVLDPVARTLLANICQRPPTRQVGGARIEITQKALILDEAGLLRWTTRLDERLRDLRLIGGRLQRGGVDVAARILANTETEGLPAVRRTGILALLRHFPGTTPCLQAAREALHDDDPAVQLEGAIALGDEGFDRVLEIAVTHPPRDLLVSALQFLGAHFTATRIEAVLAGAVPGEVSAVERVAIREAGKAHLKHLSPTLIALLDGAEAVTARAIALALAWLGDASVEPHLLALLEREDPDLRRAAAEALGQVGTSAAIEPLRACIQGWENPRLNRDMRAALAQIEERSVGEA